MVVGGTSYYIESIIYNNLVRRPADDSEEQDVEEQEEDEDAAIADRLSADAFRAYGLFRNVNDVPIVDTVDGAYRMYINALTEAVRFARTMPAVERMPFKRYRNSFSTVNDNNDERSRWPAVVNECETAALYAHGVRVLDAVLATSSSVADVQYEVLAADVTTGRQEWYTFADIQSRMGTLLARATEQETSMVIKNVLCQMHAEVEKRTQRLALALLADNEQTAVDLLPAHALKAHAMYFDPVSANELHPHNTRRVFRYVMEEYIILWPVRLG